MHRLSIQATRLVLFLILIAQAGSQAQVDPATVKTWLSDYKANQANPEDAIAIFSNPGFYVLLLKPAQEALMHGAEASRMDKQTESTAASAGTTSSVTKGSVPWLFALAVEHGALTQSVDGNLITLRGNVANLVKAMKTKDYIDVYNMGVQNAFVRNVSKASFAVSFNSASGNTSPGVNSNSFASASLHFDLYNHRDPRDAKWRKDWGNLATGKRQDLANVRGRFTDVISTKHADKLDDWQRDAKDQLSKLSPTSSDPEITASLQQIATRFVADFGNFDDVRQSAKEVQAALADYAVQKKTVISTIAQSPVLSLEYTFTNQSALSLPQSSTQSFAVKTVPPNLSNINLIFATSFGANTQFTSNASTNLFNSKPPGINSGTVRDYRFSSQLDVPLPTIPSLGTSSLSFSGLFLSLLQEPLGQQVIVNTVPISTRGNIRLLQAKWTIPIQGGGLRIPISITSSNRTELIKEKDVRGTIGISFDFDSLFSKP